MTIDIETQPGTVTATRLTSGTWLLEWTDSQAGHQKATADFDEKKLVGLDGIFDDDDIDEIRFAILDAELDFAVRQAANSWRLP